MIYKKEILLNKYLFNIFYKFNYINKYLVIYSKYTLTKNEIKYLIIILFKNKIHCININIKIFKIKIYKHKTYYNKYNIYFN